jgi:hypothetical protein
MKGVPAVYLGKLVSKENFRTFIYAIDGSQKLVESWDEYEQQMESGLWFATKEDATSRVPVAKVRAPRVKKESVKEEVKVNVNDDFLPLVSE